MKDLGIKAYRLVEELWPLNRSLISSDTARTLRRVTSDCGGRLKIHTFESGLKIGDWEIPQGWEVSEAYIEDLSGNRIIDWSKNNLHLMSYSKPMNQMVGKDELFQHLHFDSDKPDWIPYRTSYYAQDWAFCVAFKDLEKFKDTEYRVVIDSKYVKASLEIGDLFFKGKSESEVVFTTYVCHPSMANNELSGPVVLNALAKYVSSLDPYYSYRFLFWPETIGSIAYLSQELENLQKNVIAGFVVTCVGDNRAWGYISSRTGITMPDRISKRVLKKASKVFTEYSFLERGSDERQLCSPSVNLPFASVTRSKYGTYPEYHTSGDDLSVVSPESLQESIELFLQIIDEFESNRIYVATKIGEPMYSKYALRGSLGALPSLSGLELQYSNITALSDGTLDVFEISEILEQPYLAVIKLCEELHSLGILKLL
jgi:aminopeptidase-like protein